ncbi:MAG: DMT family transporter [Meiothermus ruber]|jgi:transporter family-2 protein|uniref:DMT family transporter n=1 Tax=Meiothermus ruber TaxID=277 RepID=A0A7C3HHU8_MEIRU|nr:DMT family transporter [Meiothermus sp.]MCX7802814.1 DMT family transporter [Meiothermus ruber]GIW27865.1 MAG: hypothetical protein KatS3mg070_1228 [Meiothermus sp.]
MQVFPIFIAIGTGILIAVLGPINSLLQAKAGILGLSSLVHVIGLGVSLLGLALFQQTPLFGAYLSTSQRLALAFFAVCLLLAYAGLVGIGIRQGLPWYSFLGGIIGILVVLGTVFSVRELGIANAIALLLASQVLAAALLQQFGLLGLEASPLSEAKLIGLGVLLLGAVIAIRS